MQFDLLPHPATPPAEPFRLWAKVDYAGAFGATATCNIWFGIGAPIERFAMPQADEPARRDELWKNDLLRGVRPGRRARTAYREYNFAPSGDWAAYDFTARREGMAEAELANPPYVRIEDNLTWWSLRRDLRARGGAALGAGPQRGDRGAGRDQELLGAGAWRRQARLPRPCLLHRPARLGSGDDPVRNRPPARRSRAPRAAGRQARRACSRIPPRSPAT